jgi:hypothetical protein
MDSDRCPVPLRTGYIVHVAYKRAIIKHALENFPGEYAHRDWSERGARYYSDEVYRRVGLD